MPEEWVFADEGHSGATLVRPGLEALRDLAAQGCLDVVLVYSPDRLARKFAYQALLIEELARCGVRVEFVKGPRGDSPEDQLLIQFQGMFAEYEKAQLMERYRRGKAWRAKSGSVNVLGGAPFGYRYVRKTPESGARYEVVAHEAVLVAEMFRRYADDGAAIAGLGRWLTARGVATRTGKERWDRSVIWGMLRNPAYAGTAVFGKTQVVHEPAGLNRTARLAGRTVPRQVRTQDRPREEWTGIPVPALVDEETFDRAQQRLADNKRFASRNTKVPSLLQGIAACASCGYGYYRTTTTTTAGNKIYYYRCLGSDDYRYPGGRICGNKPVRADYADKVIWDHVTALLADPALIRAEIGKRLERARHVGPGHPQARPARAGPRQDRHVDRRDDHRVLRAAPDHRRAPRPDARAPRPRDRPQGPDRRPRRPGRRPRRLPPARRRPRGLPRPAPPEFRHRHHRGQAARPARRRPRRPRRPRKDSPSATASPSGNQPAAAATTTPPTRRVTCAKVRCCVGGVITPPWGVPATVRSRLPSTITPASSHRRTSFSTLRSDTRLPTSASSRSWLISPKKFRMPDSAMNWQPPANATLSRSIACVALRFGRNPDEHGRKSASNTGSSTSFAACWATLSRTAGMPSGRLLPSGSGMSTRLAGAGRYVPSRRSC